MSGSSAPLPKPSPTDALADAPREGLTRQPVIDVPGLTEQLLGHWSSERKLARRLATDPRYYKVEGLTPADHRERVMAQLRTFAATKMPYRPFPPSVGGAGEYGGSVAAAAEIAVIADPSIQVKAGVQWGLFGAAVLHLGSAEHQQKWLPGILDLSVPGCFAMTETGHGSDVASLGTTATYDPETEEFVIDTPFRAAWKDYIGNAAIDGLAAVVFAQLITQGVSHGVHAFYTPLRDPETHEFLAGIGGDDNGIKGGLNGLDNGRLHFTGVRIPRTNLLNRYGDVAPDGSYSSPIASPGRRFFTMIGTLIQGRVGLDGTAVNASKVALKIAIQYAAERRQFNAESETEEQVLLDYQRHQRRLFPLLATTYAEGFAHEKLLHRFDEVFSGRADTDENRQNLETLAAALKPLSTWHMLDTLQQAREACGGAGYLVENRLTSLRSDFDVHVTFEGDNTILLQLVAKRLLTDYAAQFKNPDLAGLAKFALDQATELTVHRSGLRQVAQTVADTGSVRKSAIALRSEEGQRSLLTDRVQSMVAEVADGLKSAAKLPRAEAAVIFNEHQNDLVEAARAHGELVQWEAFTEALAAAPDAGTREVLTWLRDLFGLQLIEKHLAWYLMNGRISRQRARTVGEYINRLLSKLRPHALDLVDAFGYTQEQLRAPIAAGLEAERQNEAMAYFRKQRETGSAPVNEKDLRAASRAKKIPA